MGEELLDQIREWALRDENIRVVVVTGSTARGAHDRDGLSDLDVELYVGDPAALLEDDSWFSKNQFGALLAVEALPNPGWHPTRLLYMAGSKIDFMIAPLDALAGSVYERPFRVVVDKDGLAGCLRRREPRAMFLPDRAMVDECINWFFAAALMEAKALTRREPWMAKQRDWDLKCQLLRMVEWDHKARYGWSFETWFAGRFLDRWLDADIRVALDRCWAGFGIDENTRALRSTLQLFDRLASRTLPVLGLDGFCIGPVESEVSRILSLSGQTSATE
jgi:aminoglycoside 6-adenylyltransferase